MNRDPHIYETERTAEIKDKFGFTRFIIRLEEKYPNGIMCPRREFAVSGVSLQAGVRRDMFEEKFEDIGRAGAFFAMQTMKCSDIVEREEQSADSIGMYAERIEYREVDCCATCRFSVRHDMFDDRRMPAEAARNMFYAEYFDKKDFPGPCSGCLRCSNSRLFKARSADDKPDFEPGSRIPDWRHDPCQPPEMPIMPKVAENGKCKYFERKCIK